MYNILIVDDDFRDRAGICNTVKKFGLPLLPQTAECGKDALQILEEQKTDILMTDIKMPDMTGIELAETAKQLYPQLIIIVMSAYKDFQYAQSAIGFGAIKYLLKPYPVDELVKTLEYASDICRRREESQTSAQRADISAARELLLSWLQGQKNTPNAEVSDVLKATEGQFVFIKMLNCKLQNSEVLPLLTQLFPQNAFILPLKNSEYAVINCEKQRSSHAFFTQAVDAFKDKLGLQICIAYCPFRDVSLLPEEYGNVDRMREYFFFSNTSRVVCTDGFKTESQDDSDELDSLIEKIYFYISTENYSDFILAVSNLFNTLKDNSHFSSLYAKSISANIVNRLCKKRLFRDIEQEMIEKIFSSNSANEIVAVFTEAVEHISDTLEQNDNKRLISKCLSLIENEYMNDISLTYVAEKLYISPSYMSRLFKRETGKNFVDYLKEYRLKKACEMLLDTNLRVTEIAKAVGYESNSYFSTIFSGYFGITPAKYREKGTE